VSLQTTEVLPQPFVVDAVVIADPSARSLAVRLGENASGSQKMWWRVAHTALRTAKENGWGNASSYEDWRRSNPIVWANTPRADRVAHVEPAEFFNVDGAFSGRHCRFCGIDWPAWFVCVGHNLPQHGSVWEVSFRHRPS
jgi:hypothetical protein